MVTRIDIPTGGPARARCWGEVSKVNFVNGRVTRLYHVNETKVFLLDAVTIEEVGRVSAELADEMFEQYITHMQARGWGVRRGGRKNKIIKLIPPREAAGV